MQYIYEVIDKTDEFHPSSVAFYTEESDAETRAELDSYDYCGYFVVVKHRVDDGLEKLRNGYCSWKFTRRRTHIGNELTCVRVNGFAERYVFNKRRMLETVTLLAVNEEQAKDIYLSERHRLRNNRVEWLSGKNDKYFIEEMNLISNDPLSDMKDYWQGSEGKFVDNSIGSLLDGEL